MTDNIKDLILEHLRAMRGDLAAIKADTREVNGRLTSLEALVRALRPNHLGTQDNVHHH